MLFPEKKLLLSENCIEYSKYSKKIVLFATSGGSGFGKAVQSLQPSAPGAKIIAGEILNGNPNEKKLKAFAEKYL